ncbi:MAG: DUF485 domain-containing protein [Pseudomonadota bacterium]
MQWLTAGMFLALFLVLVLTIALAPEILAGAWLGGLTRGHWLVLALHVLPVISAWLYVRPRVQDSGDES